MNATAIILARAGSKGVPRKNSAMIAGKPCIAWTIEAAQAAGRIARIAVSTDDPLIAAIAHDHGAEVVHRPPDLATDTARVDDAARHAALTLDSSAPRPLDPFLLLYANVPVRPPTLFDDALRLLTSSGCDSVQSYAPVGKFHPWWTARIDPASGTVRPWEGDVLNHGVFRRQDLPAAHIPDGGVIALTRRALMLEIPGVAPGPHAFFGRDRRGIINSDGAVVDIDSPTDLAVAGAILGERLSSGAGAPPAGTRPATMRT